MTVVDVLVLVGAVLSVAWVVVKAMRVSGEPKDTRMRDTTRQAERQIDRIVQTAFREMLDEGRRHQRP